MNSSWNLWLEYKHVFTIFQENHEDISGLLEKSNSPIDLKNSKTCMLKDIVKIHKCDNVWWSIINAYSLFFYNKMVRKCLIAVL